MKLLAIDTSSNACSVALSIGDQLLERHVVEPREHTRILVPMITGILAEGKIDTADLDAVVLGNGPGSFIGMRIGGSVAQGLSFGAGIKIIPVSSLATIALEAIREHGADRVVVAQDARMNEAYLGYFTSGADGLPVAVGAESIVAVGELRVGTGQYVAAGGAWQRYPALATANSRAAERRVPLEFPRARYALEIGAASADNAVSPEALVPAYLRTKVAEKPSIRR